MTKHSLKMKAILFSSSFWFQSWSRRKSYFPAQPIAHFVTSWRITFLWDDARPLQKLYTFQNNLIILISSCLSSWSDGHQKVSPADKNSSLSAITSPPALIRELFMQSQECEWEEVATGWLRWWGNEESRGQRGDRKLLYFPAESSPSSPIFNVYFRFLVSFEAFKWWRTSRLLG